MRTFPSILLMLTALALASFNFSTNQEEPKDYLNIPGPISFNKTNYTLSWSAHPVTSFYKQEYLPKGEKPDHFNKMILIDVLADTADLKTLVHAKVQELEMRKKTIDPVVNYKLIQNPDSTEYILDFVLSQGTPTLELVEWNAYRYKSFREKSGKTGVMVFGVCMRSYGNKIKNFLSSLSDTRETVINKLIEYETPEVTLTNTH